MKSSKKYSSANCSRVDILLTDQKKGYFIVAIFGLELTINYGGPDINGYLTWLSKHNNISPLYWEKNDGTHCLTPQGTLSNIA
jgi:hypothetical protein